MTIQQYQKQCFRNYKKDIGYPESYTYLYGNPINVLVPVETTTGKVMVVGAYPSAKFFSVISKTGETITVTPLWDNDAPFSNESYFDGSQVRTIPSGKELNEVILKSIGVKREDCWITDLVKVFLFKEGHVERYRKLGRKDITENRTKFKMYAQRSLKHLYQEIELANPKFIITLGAEVASILFDASEQDIKTNYLTGDLKTLSIDGITRNTICLPHPGILMRRSDNNPWPERFEKKIAPKAKAILSKYEI